MRTYLCLPHPDGASSICLEVDLLLLCCGAAVQLVSRSFSEAIIPHVVLVVVCPWEKGSSGSSLLAILDHPLPGIFPDALQAAPHVILTIALYHNNSSSSSTS